MKRIFNYLKRVSRWVWALVILLVVLRICLPSIIKYSINYYLENKIESYQGQIEDFDLALWRGAYQIQGLRIWKRETDPSAPLLKIANIDLSLAWRALFHKEILGDLKIDGMELAFRDSESDKNKQLGTEENNWGAVAKKLVPINIESLVIHDSSVHFINKDTNLIVDIFIDQINGKANNLRNTNDSKELLPSPFHFEGRLLSATPVSVGGRVNILNPIPVFDIQADLKKFPIKKMNPLFMVYGPFNFERGDFSLYSEVAANDKKIKGYIKPFLEDAKLTSPNEKYASFKQGVNEFLLGMGNLIFRNREKTAATRIDFEGDMEDPGVYRWRALWISLKNAFVRPLKEAFDRSISIKDVPPGKDNQGDKKK
ncbi:MAG: DUF748 domain-containing protein [Bdellovibrionales bacterium]|nr:DUF748 domain-containing protein [Bdellovibrionales bacterium]